MSPVPGPAVASDSPANDETPTYTHGIVKTEEVEPTMDSGQRRELPNYAEYSNLADISVALISPGFSKQIMNDYTMRENIRRSLSVRDRQRDLIQRRLHDQDPAPPARDAVRCRKLPSQLDLNKAWSRKIGSAQTAPLYGSFPNGSPVSEACHGNHRYITRTMPYQRYREDRCTYFPQCKGTQSCQQTRLTPPQSAKRVILPPLVKSFLPSPPRSRHDFNMNVREDNGLDTLSRAARLKSTKEEFIRACSESFDAFHGIPKAKTNNAFV